MSEKKSFILFIGQFLSTAWTGTNMLSVSEEVLM